MWFSYAEFFGTSVLYFLFPSVTVYACFVAHGLSDKKLTDSRVISASLFYKGGVPLTSLVCVYLI